MIHEDIVETIENIEHRRLYDELQKIAEIEEAKLNKNRHNVEYKLPKTVPLNLNK